MPGHLSNPLVVGYGARLRAALILAPFAFDRSELDANHLAGQFGQHLLESGDLLRTFADRLLKSIPRFEAHYQPVWRGNCYAMEVPRVVSRKTRYS